MTAKSTPDTRESRDGSQGEKKWTCPNCGKAGIEDTRPFCSERCANLDLGRWFNGSYAVPVEGDQIVAGGDDEDWD